MIRRRLRLVLFYHSLVSDWNHGNAHFLRGYARELSRRGHDVRILEPADGWSRANLLREQGAAAQAAFARAFPELRSTTYDAARLDLDQALDGADAVIVHEWTDPRLVRRIARHRAGGGRYRLLFHDTHHRAVSDAAAIGALGLDGFDGVLAFGEVLRQAYERRGWARRAWTWHEAADIPLFRPHATSGIAGDLVWIGNWGDGERSAELETYLLRPIRELRLKARLYGVRYPEAARRAVAAAGASHGGWLANHEVPRLLARYRATVHVPRRPYARALPGIPTIRVFEALAAGVPLLCAPWDDVEGLFRPGRDFLVAKDGRAMIRNLKAVLGDPALAGELARSGRETILARHTCGHRVDELLAILAGLGVERAPSGRPTVAEAR